MWVLGTAGHVDHGKSKLVEALTGIDPDRLEEEKERGLTIDLGFAWLTLPSGETISIVDVPGHEDFIKNMLAGVGGIDAAILVVAADEGIMPQTREHLAILDLLRVKHGVVAITKADLAEDELWLELVKEEVSELLQGATLEDAELVIVSAQTGRGLDEVLSALDRLTEVTPLPQDIGRPRLPVDRVFTVAGFGTVVTGTLIDGAFQVGDEVEILPQGIRSQVRGLQTHKEEIKTAVPGSRVAINLSRVDTEDLKRGNVVTMLGWLEPTRLIDVRMRMLPGAPKPLRHDMEVELFAGSAQIMARTRILGTEVIAQGQTGWAQFRLAEPIVVAREDRFIIRQPSPGLTIGGGSIVDPHPRRRHRRFREDILRRLEHMAEGTPEDILWGTLRKEEPRTAKELVHASNLQDEDAARALGKLIGQNRIYVLDDSDVVPERLIHSEKHVISDEGWWQLVGRMTDTLDEYHRKHPLRQGMPREELRSRLHMESSLFNSVLRQATAEGRAALSETSVRLPDHQVEFNPAQERKIEELHANFDEQPYTPPTLSEAEKAVGSEVLYALIEREMLIKVSDDVVFTREAYEEMVDQIRERIESTGSITVAEARDLFDSSRKYTLALLEHLDDVGITWRVGDKRVLRG